MILDHDRSWELMLAKRKEKGLWKFTEVNGLMQKHRGNSLSSYIRNWVNNTNGQFHTSELDADLGITSPQAKSLRRGVLKVLCDQGKLKRIPGLIGVYRPLELELKEVDWQS